jgi:hypothetical protein
MTPVPGLDLVVAARRSGKTLQLGLVDGRLLARSVPHRFEQGHDGGRRLGHGVVQFQRRIGAVADKLRLLGAQSQHVLHHVAIIGRAARLAAPGKRLECFFAQIASLGKRRERLVDGARQGDGVFAFPAARFGRLRHRALQEFGQAGKVLFGQEQHPLLFVGKHVLAESRAERGQFLVDRGQPLLAVGVELRARFDEAFPGLFQNAQRLGVEAEIGAAGMKVVDAGEQFFVH